MLKKAGLRARLFFALMLPVICAPAYFFAGKFSRIAAGQ
jgi:hypothetical protein